MRRVSVSLVFIWAFSALQATGADITAGFETNVTSGPSPLAVSFNATGTRHSDPSVITNRFHELLFSWDYGDPTSGTWAPTGKSRNYMSGPLGAHVFEPTAFPKTCGVTACEKYTVTLEVRDENDNYDTWEKTITVYDPNSGGANGWGDAKETVCISRAGRFAGCPAGATRVSSSSAVQSLLAT